MKRLLLLSLTVLSAVLMGCEKEKGMSQDEMNRYLKPVRVDLSSAEYLAIVDNGGTKSNSSDKDVFKIDKDGNMTALVFHFIYSMDENGKTVSEEKRSDVRVVPSRIFCYDGIYTHFVGCQLIDPSGTPVNFKGDYGSLIIRNSDGAIFGLPYDLWGMNVLYTFVDQNKNLYTAADGQTVYEGIFKLKFNESDAMVYRINSENMPFKNFAISEQSEVLIAGRIKDGIYIKENDPFYYRPYTPTIFYPNGGFEQIEINYNQTLANIGRKFKLIKYHEDNNNNLITLHNVNLSTKPPYTISENNSTAEAYNVLFCIPCKNHYVLGVILQGSYDVRLLIYDHNTDELKQTLTPNKFPALDYSRNKESYFPNRIGNTVFSIDNVTKTIKSYDFETLAYSEVIYDDSALGGFFETGTTFIADPPTFIKYGNRGLDGKPVILYIDIKTGAVTTEVGKDTRNITQLVRLN